MPQQSSANRPTQSIAVLPFVNRSSDPDNEYFSDGISEEIINALTRIRDLKVIARTSSFSYKGKAVDIRTIGEELDVATVLEGSVRRIETRVRITAQLVDTNTGLGLWSKNFDRELIDIFAIQDEISQLIADQIRENFGHFEIADQLQVAPTKSVAAYDLFLRGSYCLKRKDFADIQRALPYFEKAVALDPEYAEAYALIGETLLHYSGFGLIPSAAAHERARQVADKALEINPQEARAHKVKAYIALFYDWNWQEARQAYDEAVRCGLPDQNEFIGYYYIFLEKDFDKAIQAAKGVLVTDPLHVISHWQLGMCYYFAGRFKEALAAFDNALRLDDQFGEAHRWRGLVLAFLERFAEGQIAVEKALALTNGEGPAKMDMLIVKILMGQKQEVLPEIEATTYLDSTDPAMLYSLLNMPDEAIRFLQKGYEERSVMMVSLKHYWIWDNIRADERFQELYSRMNFSRLAPPKEPQKTARQNTLLNEAEVAHFTQRLKVHMENDEPYLDPSVSLRQLAEHLDLHPNKLSWLINEAVGQNFNEYINSFRLRTFKSKALDPANAHLTLLGLAYESGFNSKTVFNAFFKKMEGLTPRAWVKAQEKA